MEYEVNKLRRDEFGRVSGILAINKPAGMTSHDIVYAARKALKTKQVGHAGALDPFATGVLIILVGKATKLSDIYLGQSKEYIAKVLFGVATDSADPEGKILQTEIVEIDQLALEQALPKFTPEYEQFVPIYSSVKVEGEKLRVLARKAARVEIDQQSDKRIARFHIGDSIKEVEIPKHLCQIYDIELKGIGKVDLAGTEFYTNNHDQLKTTEFATADILVACSKGTYIRTLAEDIGGALNPPLPAMLWELTRTKVGNIDIKNALSIEQLSDM